MSVGIRRTFDVLRQTENNAAIELMVEFVFSGPPPFDDEALDFLIEKKDREAFVSLVSRYHRLTPAQQNKIAHLGVSLSFAIRQAYLDLDPQVYTNAMTLIEREPAYEQLSLILGSIERESARKEDAKSLIELLSLKLCDEIDGTAAEKTVGDAEMVRRQFLSSLDVAMRRFQHHKVAAVPEAYLALADAEDLTIRAILNEPGHACHLPVVEALKTKQDMRYIRWIFTSLGWKNPPQAILRILARRRDPWFIDQFLDRIDLLAEPTFNHNIRLLRDIAWLAPGERVIDDFSESHQSAAVILAANSGLPLAQKLDIFSRILEGGSALARQAAACALLPLTGSVVNGLINACLSDDDPNVQLAAIRQIRMRNLPNALAMLMNKLDHSDPRIRKVARDMLAEDFSFEKFTKAFDQMDERVRSTVGTMIARIDDRTNDKIREQLFTDQRNIRIRAIRIIQTLGFTAAFWKDLSQLLGDQDHVVRRLIIETLLPLDEPAIVTAFTENVHQGPRELVAGSLEALETLRKESPHSAIQAAANTALESLQPT